MEDYEKLLEKAREELPEDILKAERFEIPKVKGHIQGNKTIINNFAQIADTLRREPEHLMKYLLREIAAPGEIKKGSLIIKRKVSASAVNDKIKQYADNFVICPECKKPDTKITKKDKTSFIKCLACGAQHLIRTKI